MPATQIVLWPTPPCVAPTPTPVHLSDLAVTPDTSELLVPYSPPRLHETARHAGWHPVRKRIYDAMIDADQSPSRLTAYAECGAKWALWVADSYDTPTRYRLTPRNCHDRLCTPCARLRSATIAERVQQYLPDHPVRMLTLTLAHTDAPLAAQLRRLVLSFRRLRSWAEWTYRVTGGVAFVEIKLARDGEHWHPHLHILLLGKYLPHHLIRDRWLDITGDSTIVEISLVRGRAAAAKYVAKYASKPLSGDVTRSPRALREAIIALAGRRLAIPFGTCHRWRLTESPANDGWTYLGMMTDYEWRALCGNAVAQQIVDAARTADPYTLEFALLPIPPPTAP